MSCRSDLRGCQEDRRLLQGEARRALLRLAAIRALVDQLRSEQRISPEAYAEVWALAHAPEDQG